MCVTYYISSKLLQRNIYYVKKTVCNGADPTQRWMWTRYNQLLNIDTLKCLQKDKWHSFYQYNLALEECNLTEAKQIWQCRERTKINFGLRESQNYMVCGDDSDCKLKSGNDPTLPSITWQRFQSGENLCSRGRLDVFVFT